MNSTLLKDEILNTGNELVNKGPNAGPALRKLQSKFYQPEISDSHIKFLCFFLFNFIDDLYFNLTGDFPYEKRSSTIIDSIFKNVGQSLLKLVEELNSNTPDNCYRVYLDMVQSYLDGVTQIANLKTQE